MLLKHHDTICNLDLKKTPSNFNQIWPNFVTDIQTYSTWPANNKNSAYWLYTSFSCVKHFVTIIINWNSKVIHILKYSSSSQPTLSECCFKDIGAVNFPSYLLTHMHTERRYANVCQHTHTHRHTHSHTEIQHRTAPSWQKESSRSECLQFRDTCTRLRLNIDNQSSVVKGEHL